MEKITRPKKVSKREKHYLTNEKYQTYSESQFNTIYNKVDEIINEISNLPEPKKEEEYVELYSSTTWGSKEGAIKESRLLFKKLLFVNQLKDWGDIAVMEVPTFLIDTTNKVQINLHLGTEVNYASVKFKDEFNFSVTVDTDHAGLVKIFGIRKEE